MRPFGNLPITCLTACILSGCGGQKGQAPPDPVEPDRPATDEGSRDPAEYCVLWVRSLIEDPDAVPLVPGLEIEYHGRLGDQGGDPQPDVVRDAGLPFALEYGIDVAKGKGGAMHCTGLIVASIGAQEGGEVSFGTWQAGRYIDTKDIPDGHWQAAYLVDVDLVPRDGVLEASRAFIALQYESYRAGRHASHYGVRLDEEGSMADMDGDGTEETVILTIASLDSERPLTQEDLMDYYGEAYDAMDTEIDEDDRIVDRIDAQTLIVVDETPRFVMWKTFEPTYSSDLDSSLLDEPGYYELVDLGIGTVALGFRREGRSYELPCASDGEQGNGWVVLAGHTSFEVYEGGTWRTIFTLAPHLEEDRACSELPESVEVLIVEHDDGPSDLQVEWEPGSSESRTDVWRWDGESYRLEKTSSGTPASDG